MTTKIKDTSRKNSKKLSLRKPNMSSARATTLALSIPGFIAAPMALAEDAVMLDTLQIEERTVDTNPYAEEGAPYKAKSSGDIRRVKPLAETPQTIQVLTQTAIQESGDTDLRAILANQPGITLGTGENGNAFGDRYVIRGHEARSDVFVDGLRDPGMTIRESFAVEQVEITKGPSSTFAGRGSTGGAVNSITKQAETEYNFNRVQAGVGSDDFRRFTLDSNISVSDNTAIRANLLHSYQEIPDRGPADRERNGIALSGAFKVNEKLNLVADYYRLEAEDTPDLGSYIVASTGVPDPDAPVYLQEEDFLESTVDTFTFRADYQFSDSLRLNNATRYGTTDNGYVATGTRGTSLSTHQGWQEVEYFANMSNLFFNTDIGGTTHQFVGTLEYSSHKVLNGVYQANPQGATNCIVAGRGGTTNPGYCFVDDDGNLLPNINTLLQRDISKSNSDSDYNIDTWSLALMDTIDLSDKWSLFVGLRADHFEYENKVLGRGATTPTIYEYSDTLFNGHAGITYDINDEALMYVTYSTSANINGGESDVGGSCGYGGICGDPIQVEDSEPEQTQNIEIGAKWNIMNEKLLLSAAIFQITKDDVMESVGDSYEALGTLNTGKNKVDGFEISATGNITQKFSIQTGAAFMNAEIEDSFEAENIGKTLANFADKSAFAQLRYQLSNSFSFGGIASYSSEVFVGQPDTAANEDVSVPSYTVYDVFASYQISPKTSVRLNVGNVTDKDYYLTAYRSGAFAYIGDRRNAQLTLSHEF